MRHFSITGVGDHRGGHKWRGCNPPAKVRFCALAEGFRQGFHKVELIGLLTRERTLRRLVSYLLLAFFVVLLIGTITHFIRGKQVALKEASAALMLIADAVAASVKAHSGQQITDWQDTLAASLPAGATANERTLMLTDAAGTVPGPCALYRQGNRHTSARGFSEPTSP